MHTSKSTYIIHPEVEIPRRRVLIALAAVFKVYEINQKNRS